MASTLQTRIKVVEDSNGDSFYYPEYRFLCFWLGFRDSGYANRMRFEKLDGAKVFLRDILRARQYKHNVRSYIYEE